MSQIDGAVNHAARYIRARKFRIILTYLEWTLLRRAVQYSKFNHLCSRDVETGEVSICVRCHPNQDMDLVRANLRNELVEIMKPARSPMQGELVLVPRASDATGR